MIRVSATIAGEPSVLHTIKAAGKASFATTYPYIAVAAWLSDQKIQLANEIACAAERSRTMATICET